MSVTPEEDAPGLRRWVFALLAVVTVMGVLGTALSPWLLVRWPLVLVALSPDVRHLVLVAAQLELLPVLLVGEPRRAAGLLAMYGIGWLYGPLAIAWFEEQAPRLGGALRLAERLFARFGAPLLVLLPAYTFGAVAGAARTPLRIFVPAMLLGQALYITGSYYFGDWMREWTKPLLAFLAEHLVASTAVCVAAVVLQQLWSRRDRSGDAAGQ